jgi:hypothetical protein
MSVDMKMFKLTLNQALDTAYEKGYQACNRNMVDLFKCAEMEDAKSMCEASLMIRESVKGKLK